MTEFKKINELPLVTTIGDNDRLIVETATGTKAVTKSAFKEEAQTITKEDVGLGNVDNTSDMDKPISTLVQAELNKKASTNALSNAIAGLAETYLTIDDAQSTYLTQNNASGTYLTQSNAALYYVSKDDFNTALSGLESLLAEV